jgi:hypothetical protein
MSKSNPEFETLYARAHLAGYEAATRCTPAPMVVQEHVDMMDDSSPVAKQWHVPEGVCGFAWITVRPGTSRFARWLKATDRARTDRYYGGVTIWVGAFGQSYERKCAYARAFTAVLVEAGIRAAAGDRLD